jgi:hypothetical protein
MVKRSKTSDDDEPQNKKGTNTLKKTKRTHEIAKLPAVLRKITDYAKKLGCHVGLMVVPNKDNDISKTFGYYSTNIQEFHNLLVDKCRYTVVDDDNLTFVSKISKEKQNIDELLPDSDFIDDNLIYNIRNGDVKPMKVIKKR